MNTKNWNEFMDLSPALIPALLMVLASVLMVGATFKGVYLQPLNLIWCTTPDSCIHEQAHAMDAQNGNISSTNMYRMAVQDFIETDPGNPWALVAAGFPVTDRSYRELYACMWEAARGDVLFIPDKLKPFYGAK